MTLELPPAWADGIRSLPVEGGPSGREWLARLPRVLDDCVQQWDLAVTGSPWTGHTAIVFPAERDGIPLVLKVGWPHRESAAEHLALRHWGGRGAVSLVAADPARGALLLEPLDPSRTLTSVPIDRACEVAGALLARLHVTAPPTIPPLRPMIERWVGRLAHAEGLPRRMVSRTESLAGELLSDTSPPKLLHGDLHFNNVLASKRDKWLAIDPKPSAGQPGWEVHALLRNRVEELRAAASFRAAVRRRLEIVAEAAGIDLETARQWSLVHTGIQAGWAAAASDKDATSLNIALFKALED